MLNSQLPLQPVLLAGGSGTRLWPLSRKEYPKQFLPLFDEKSCVQATWQRVAQLATAPAITVVNESHRFLVLEQLEAVNYPQDGLLLLEPEGRNTAPAIALAALAASQNQHDALLLVLPADHLIRPNQAFINTVKAAIPAAENDFLITFGIRPSSAHTGYGYIKAHEAVSEQLPGVLNVEAFVEKPSADRAQAYLENSAYSWNSGVFLFKASRYLKALRQHCPEILEACEAAFQQRQTDGRFTRVGQQAFLSCPAESIDYAILEKDTQVAMVPLDAFWSDIGSWQALWEVDEKDSNNNVLFGDVLIEQSQNAYVRADTRLVALLGVDDVVVIDTPDAVLVAAKDKVQEVRTFVDQLRQHNRPEADTHRRVYRPWGHYDAIDDGDRFQVKRITVKPGGRLSVQLHHHRAEHWVVVRGTAQVSCGEETFLLSENQSTYIPLGVVHRLENPGRIPLELIEVQSGSYLGEDDIVRLDDAYGRKDT